jgi:hypothetical protein
VKAVALVSLSLSLGACAPLTFSNEAVVDFALYQAIRVTTGGPDGAARHARYLADELGASSGFAAVTVEPSAVVDAVLDVSLALALDVNNNLLSDDSPDYSARASFQLATSQGRRIDSGSASSSDHSDPFEAAEAVLDEIVNRYLPAYRL